MVVGGEIVILQDMRKGADNFDKCEGNRTT